ncbi:MAG TPA: hypothetical protein VL574_01330 [Stellaceae bacterium]|nr:hypothetical protein [Stellaceae bacterium]
MQALENAALGQYRSGPSFDVALNAAMGADGSTVAGSGAAGDMQLSGTFKGESLIAVGRMDADGQMIPFSAEQVQKEETAAASMQQTSYADSLHNFLLLAQESSTNGQIGPASYTDHQSFVGDDGLISTSYDTSLSLNPANT